MSSRIAKVLAFATASVFAGSAFAQVVDGALGAGPRAFGEYEFRLATQTTGTGFGDNFSQLDAAYVNILSDGSLQLLLTGNLEGNYNGLLIWFDNGRPGATSLGNQPDRSIGSIAGERGFAWGNRDGTGNGSIFAEGFDPARLMSLRGNNDEPARGPTDVFYNNFTDTSRPSPEFGESDVFMGAVPWLNHNVARTGLSGSVVPTTFIYSYVHFGIDYSGTIEQAFDSSNAITFADGSPLLATTGYETRLSAGPFGLAPGEQGKIMAIITGSSGAFGDSFLSNQALPGLPLGTPNIGPPAANNDRVFDQNNWPTITFLTLPTPPRSSGDWHVDTDWTTRFAPNGLNTQARFVDAAAGPVAVTLASSVQVGTLYLDSAGGVSINPAAASTPNLVMAAIPGDVTVVRSAGGDHAINVPVVLQSPVSFQLTGGATVTVPEGIRSVIDAAPRRGLAVAGDGDVITPVYYGGPISVTGAGASLRLVQGAVVVGQAESEVRDLVASAFIVPHNLVPFSALAVRTNEINNNGVADFGTFLGNTVFDTDVLVLHTWQGDVNLDGVLDAIDFNAILNGFTNGLTGWANGDINYDGLVDGLDWDLFLTALAGSGGGPFALGGSGTGVIPEPAALGLLALAFPALTRRRR